MSTSASWLQTNTFHHGDFSDVAALVRLKERAGTRVSVVLPTLNEARTIGAIVTILRESLMGRHRLVDDILIVDSGSTDDTQAIARLAGARTLLADDILQDVPARRGKGENIWKALHATNSDILCALDADIANMHPRFVTGLVGPLLTNPAIDYVKAFYNRPERPSHLNGDAIPTGGGRVTEILVRPLLSLFLPELTNFVQPLAGEFAARRSLLETLPFPTGYGLEIAHLLDIHFRHGLKPIAQSDLEFRDHRHQALPALGKMSFSILHTFLTRLECHGLITSHTDFGDLLRQFPTGGTIPATHTLADDERPPILTIPAYTRAKTPRPKAGLIAA